MDIEKIFQDLVKELELTDLSKESQEETLLEIATSVQKQFFLDVYNKIGKDMFEALEASIKMGEEFYTTTLKHLVPDYEEIFQNSRKKIIDAYKKTPTVTESDMIQ